MSDIYWDKRNRCWAYHLPVPGKRRTTKRVFRGATKEQARELYLNERMEIASVGYKARKMTLDHYYMYEWKRYTAPLTNIESTLLDKDRIYKKHIRENFGEFLLKEITPAEIKKFQQKLLHENYATQTINNTIALLSTILNGAVVDGYIDGNPKKSVRHLRSIRGESRKIVDFWTHSELRAVLEKAKEMDYKIFQLILFATKTGLRPGELQGLKRDCLNFDEGYVVVKRSWCSRTLKLNDWTKGKIERTISVPRTVLRFLMDKVNLDPDAFVFPDTEVYRVMNKLPNRLRRYPEGLYNFKNLGEQWIKPIARAAGVKVLSPHGMRHTFGTHLAMLDGQYKKEIVEIRDLMGHASLTSTQKYIHTAEMYRPNATDPLMIGMDFLESGMKIVKLARNGSNADQSFSRI